MRRLYLFALGLVIVVIGIAAFVTLPPIFQPKPHSVKVSFFVASYNGAGGCLNVASIPMTILKVDGIPLDTGNTTSPFSGVFNGTVVTLTSGTSHVISANQTYTGTCNGCAECQGFNIQHLTISFWGWGKGNDTPYSLGKSPTLDFQVPSNMSTFVIIAGYSA